MQVLDNELWNIRKRSLPVRPKTALQRKMGKRQDRLVANGYFNQICLSEKSDAENMSD